MLYNKFNLAVAKIAAKDGTREEIKSVLFKHNLTAATDAICLLEVSTDTTVKVEEFPRVQGANAMLGCKPFLADAKQISEIKLPRVKNGLPVLEFAAIKHLDEKRIDFLTTDLETANIKSVRRFEGKFPDYEGLFPTGDPRVRVVINGAKLVELLKVMSELNKLGAVEMRIYGEDKPVELRAEGVNQRARGLIMPIRE